MLITLLCMTVWYAVLFPDRFEFAQRSCHGTCAKTNAGLARLAGVIPLRQDAVFSQTKLAHLFVGDLTPVIAAISRSCKRNHIDPQSYLQYVLERIADHPIDKIDQLMPWNVTDKLNQPEQVTKMRPAQEGTENHRGVPQNSRRTMHLPFAGEPVGLGPGRRTRSFFRIEAAPPLRL